MDELQQLGAYVAGFSPVVQKNVTLVEPRPLMHISINAKISKFVPALSRRTAKVEDRSVPRVSVAPTVVGCLAGYMADLSDFEYGPDKEYKGGWYIYSFQGHPSLRPQPKILYDADITDEHWLVPFRPDLWVYPADIAGKFFYSKLSMRWENKVLFYDTDLVFEVYPGRTIQADTDVLLSEGFWALSATRGKLGSARNVRRIKAGEYAELKGLTATLLAYEEPASAQW